MIELNHKQLLIIFTKFPEPGKTKTRLSPALGKAAAADCQRQMTEHVLAQAQQLTHQDAIDLQIHYHGANLSTLRAWLGPRLTYCAQSGENLGQRMARAFFLNFQKGYNRIILIGSDCPDISPAILRSAITTLRPVDLVLGPATDGGYYLIGLHQPHPELFTEVDWGSNKVLAQTITHANHLNLSISQLEALHDIDTPSDLQHFRHYTHP